MQSILWNAFRLTVTNVEFDKTVASFLAEYSCWGSGTFGYVWNKLIGLRFLVPCYDQVPNFFC